jgi:hypothetical protein
VTLFEKELGVNPRASSAGHLVRRDQRRPALPFYRSTHVFVSDAPVYTRTPNLVEVHPQPTGLLPGGIRSVRLLLRSNQLTGDTRQNADVSVRNALPDL